MPLSRDQILKVNDLKTEAVEVPEWGGTVLVRALTAKERLDLTREMTGADGKINRDATLDLQIRLPYLCMVDESGARLFESEADLIALQSKSAAALERVFGVAQRLSALTKQAADEQKKD